MAPLPPPLPPLPPQMREHWRLKRRLTVKLLAVWLVSTFVVIYFARALDTFSLFGWPISFYMAAQGMGLLYLALVAIYTVRMDKLETQLRIQLLNRAHPPAPVAAPASASTSTLQKTTDHHAG